MSFAAAAVGIGTSMVTNKMNQQGPVNTTPKFADEVQPLVQQTADNLLNTAPIEVYQGDRVADFTGMQQQGLAQTPGLATNLDQQAGTAAAGFQQFASGGMINQNPFLEQSITAMRESANTDLSRNQLPMIRNNAVAAGGVGGSRQGIAEGLAMSDLNRQMISTEAGMRQGQFNQDMQNQLTALTGQSQILGGQQLGQQALMTAGGMQQGQNQNEMNAVQQQFTEEQNLQYDRDQKLMQIMMGAPTATTQPVAQANPLVTGLGAALTTSQLFQNPTQQQQFNSGATNTNNPGSSMYSTPNQYASL